MSPPPQPDESGPHYGPRGYLPERAARRARKIVLREPMGLQWPIAAGVAALLLLVVGTYYLLTSTGPPGPPARAVASIDQIDPRGQATFDLAGTHRQVLVVRGGGGVALFEAPDGTVAWCPRSRRLEAADGRVWTLDGRLVGGDGASLRPLDGAVYDGMVYVDPTARRETPTPRTAGEEPVCG